MANNPSSPGGKSGDKTEFLKELEKPPIQQSYKGSEKLTGKVAIITGGDSGIGRSIAVHFAREGADVVIAYNEADDDAVETKRLVEAEGRKCITFKADLSEEQACQDLISKATES